MAKPIRLLVDVSDTHCGSLVGLLPPDFHTILNQPVPQNQIQQWLWTCWTEANKWLADTVGDDSYALVINGDITEGCHHGTKEIISSDPADHFEAANQVLQPLTGKAAKTFLVEGTECHSGTLEHSFAKIVGAVPDPNTGKAAWEKLFVSVGGCRCVFQHHISPTVREYLRASMLSIFLGNEQLAAANNGEPIPRVLGCAHRHAYDYYESGDSLCFVTPPWQIKTRHGNKVVPASRTKPGIVVLDWRGRDDGDLPERRVRTFRSVQVQGIEL